MLGVCHLRMRALFSILARTRRDRNIDSETIRGCKPQPRRELEAHGCTVRMGVLEGMYCRSDCAGRWQKALVE